MVRSSFFAVLLCAGLLAACATQPPARAPANLFDDGAFAPPSHPVDAAEVFAFSPAMRQYLEVEIAPQIRSLGRHRTQENQDYPPPEPYPLSGWLFHDYIPPRGLIVFPLYQAT